MSKKWSKTHDIEVKGTKTVQEVYNGAGGRTKNPVTNYVTGGTCIGTASGAEKTRKGKEENDDEIGNIIK